MKEEEKKLFDISKLSLSCMYSCAYMYEGFPTFCSHLFAPTYTKHNGNADNTKPRSCAHLFILFIIYFVFFSESMNSLLFSEYLFLYELNRRESLCNGIRLDVVIANME